MEISAQGEGRAPHRSDGQPSVRVHAAILGRCEPVASLFQIDGRQNSQA
jgi:hypothetical protein